MLVVARGRFPWQARSSSLGHYFKLDLTPLRKLFVSGLHTPLKYYCEFYTDFLRQSTGRFVLGLGVGAYSAGVPLYISEISPAELRGRIVGIELMILCFGEMVVFWVVYAFYFLNSDDWWRLPLAIQIIPALILAVGCWTWVPPSPRWLVAEERYECALEVLSRLHGSEAAELEISEIRKTVSEEQVITQASWSDMFKRPVLRVTLLGVCIQMFQQITGTNGIFYYAPSLFKKGGITDPTMANLATGGVGVVLFLSSWIPIFYFERFGRKTWFQFGLIGMFSALIGICVLQQHAIDHPNSPANNAIVIFPYMFFTFFNMSWSSGSWAYAAEIFPISLRVSRHRTAYMIYRERTSLISYPGQRKCSLYRLALDFELCGSSGVPSYRECYRLWSLCAICNYLRRSVLLRALRSW